MGVGPGRNSGFFCTYKGKKDFLKIKPIVKDCDDDIAATFRLGWIWI